MGLSIFIVFDRVPYGRLQALASVELSVFLSFLIMSHMVDYRLALVWSFPFFVVFICA